MAGRLLDPLIAPLSESQRTALGFAGDTERVWPSNRNVAPDGVHSGSAIALDRLGLLRAVAPSGYSITDRGREALAEIRGDRPPPRVTPAEAEIERHRAARSVDPTVEGGVVHVEWPADVDHGTPEGYAEHRARGDTSCPPCRDAFSVVYWTKDPIRRRDGLAACRERAAREAAVG